MRVTLHSMLQALLALFDRRTAESRSELLEMLDSRMPTKALGQKTSKLVTSPSTRRTTRGPAPIAKKRRADSEWSETQPWCHL